jgi:hypothetical protein
MSSFYSHNIIKKYTTGLLDTFNNLTVERTMSNNTKSYITVPITYGSRDKAFVMSQMDIEQFLTNNYNVLPRMALSLTSINKRSKNDTNKLQTINKINRVVGDKTITFQYNAVAYNFNYELAIAARSMIELSMILEQILPHFNPTHNLRIMELDIQEEPTTIPVGIVSTELDVQTNIHQDDDIRIAGATIMLELRGNVYQPFTDAAMIDNVRLYFNTWNDTTIADTKRNIKYEFDVDNTTNNMIPSTLFKTDWVEANNVGKNAPGNWYLIAQDGTAILNQEGIPVLSPNTMFISGNNTMEISSTSQYKINFMDVDDETGFIYLWNILSGNAIISQNNVNPVTITSSANAGVILLQAQVVDKDGNASAYTTKNIIVQ